MAMQVALLHQVSPQRFKRKPREGLVAAHRTRNSCVCRFVAAKEVLVAADDVQVDLPSWPDAARQS
jgi:hypothetical protein